MAGIGNKHCNQLSGGIWNRIVAKYIQKCNSSKKTYRAWCFVHVKLNTNECKTNRYALFVVKEAFIPLCYGWAKTSSVNTSIWVSAAVVIRPFFLLGLHQYSSYEEEKTSKLDCINRIFFIHHTKKSTLIFTLTEYQLPVGQDDWLGNTHTSWPWRLETFSIYFSSYSLPSVVSFYCLRRTLTSLSCQRAHLPFQIY